MFYLLTSTVGFHTALGGQCQLLSSSSVRSVRLASLHALLSSRSSCSSSHWGLNVRHSDSLRKKVQIYIELKKSIFISIFKSMTIENKIDVTWRFFNCVIFRNIVMKIIVSLTFSHISFILNSTNTLVCLKYSLNIHHVSLVILPFTSLITFTSTTLF